MFQKRLQIWGRSLANSGPINSISNDLIIASEDMPQKRLQIWGKSLASASPSELYPNQRLLRYHSEVVRESLQKHCVATVPDFHDVEEPDAKPTRPQCRGLRDFPKLLEAGTHHESRSWLLDLPLGWRVLRVATIVHSDVDPTEIVTPLQHRSSPLASWLRATGFHECEGTAGLGKEHNSESPQM